MSEVSGFATFVLRLAHDEAGQLTGVVERVATAEKARVDSLEAIPAAIGRMVTAEEGWSLEPRPSPAESP